MTAVHIQLAGQPDYELFPTLENHAIGSFDQGILDLGQLGSDPPVRDTNDHPGVIPRQPAVSHRVVDPAEVGLEPPGDPDPAFATGQGLSHHSWTQRATHQIGHQIGHHVVSSVVNMV